MQSTQTESECLTEKKHKVIYFQCDKLPVIITNNTVLPRTKIKALCR